MISPPTPESVSSRRVSGIARLKQSNLVRGLLGVGALRIISLPLTLATSILLARALGAEDYGRYAFVVSLATLLSLPSGQGVTELLTREIAHGVEEKHPRVHRVIMLWAWRRLAVYGLGILAVATVLFFVLRGGQSITWLSAALLAPFVAGYQVYGGAIRGHGASVQSQIPEMLVRPLGILILIGITWAVGELTLSTALAGHVIATAGGLGLSWWLLRRIAPTEVFSTAPVSETARWNRSSISFMLIATTNYMNIEIGIFGLGLLGLPEEVSGMRIAQSGAQLVILPLVAVDLVTQSKIALLARLGDGAALRSTYVRATRLAFCAALLTGLPLILLPDIAVRVAFGEDYVALASGPLIVLSITQILNAAFGAAGTLLNMSGHEDSSLRAQIASIVVTVPGVFFLGVPFGATGAALAVLAGMAVKKLTEMYYVHKSLGVWLHVLSKQA